jgi:hypothetical protein
VRASQIVGQLCAAVLVKIHVARVRLMHEGAWAGIPTEPAFQAERVCPSGSLNCTFVLSN